MPAKRCSDSAKRGGPRTEDGKRTSHKNSLKHGLTARTLLPEILARDLTEQCYARLQQEWQPASPTQEFLVREMARHEAALERIHACEDAVLRRGAWGALGLVTGDTDESVTDVALAGAGTSDGVHRVIRYRRSHERGFARSMQALRELGATPHATPDGPRPGQAPLDPFATTEACERHLIGRFESGQQPCPHCQAVEGIYIASRQVWQCRGCRRQRSLRAGTVMERSRIDLPIWFRAIAAVLSKPEINTAQLAEVTGLRRAATVRNLRSKIRTAVQSANATDQLAGLPAVFLQGAHA